MTHPSASHVLHTHRWQIKCAQYQTVSLAVVFIKPNLHHINTKTRNLKLHELYGFGCRIELSLPFLPQKAVTERLANILSIIKAG